jgi:hypothetical protein
MTSYQVKFWDVKKIGDTAKGRWRVRWAVAGREHCKSLSFFHPGFPQGMRRFDRPGPGSFCWSSGVRGAVLGYGGADGSGVAAR